VLPSETTQLANFFQPSQRELHLECNFDSAGFHSCIHPLCSNSRRGSSVLKLRGIDWRDELANNFAEFTRAYANFTLLKTSYNKILPLLGSKRNLALYFVLIDNILKSCILRLARRRDVLSRTLSSRHVGSTPCLQFPTAAGAGPVGSGKAKTIPCFGTEGPLF